jgi:hypothetical protein
MTYDDPAQRRVFHVSKVSDDSICPQDRVIYGASDFEGCPDLPKADHRNFEEQWPKISAFPSDVRRIG